MSQRVLQVSFQRDYGKYIYYVDANGSVCSKAKGGDRGVQVLMQCAVQRLPKMMYYIDKEGWVCCTPIASQRKKAAV